MSAVCPGSKIDSCEGLWVPRHRQGTGTPGRTQGTGTPRHTRDKGRPGTRRPLGHPGTRRGRGRPGAGPRDTRAQAGLLHTLTLSREQDALLRVAGVNHLGNVGFHEENSPGQASTFHLLT